MAASQDTPPLDTWHAQPSIRMSIWTDTWHVQPFVRAITWPDMWYLPLIWMPSPNLMASVSNKILDRVSRSIITHLPRSLQTTCHNLSCAAYKMKRQGWWQTIPSAISDSRLQGNDGSTNLQALLWQPKSLPTIPRDNALDTIKGSHTVREGKHS